MPLRSCISSFCPMGFLVMDVFGFFFGGFSWDVLKQHEMLSFFSFGLFYFLLRLVTAFVGKFSVS